MTPSDMPSDIPASETPIISDTPPDTLSPTVTNTPVGAPPPSLTSPVHRTHTIDRTPSFAWSVVANAQSYRLFIYNADRTFSFKKRTFNTSYTLQTPLTPQKYQWRVRTQSLVDNSWGGME